MKKLIWIIVSGFFSGNIYAQNVGIGTVTPLEKLHVVGNKAYFQTNFLGIGTNNPTTGFTGFALKSNINSFYGMYVDAGVTGEPFYGFALNGVPKSYLSFASAGDALEYHQTSDATPDFFVNGNTRAVFNTGFVGIGTGTPTSGFTSFAIKKNINDFLGMYIDAGATGKPFYGYSLNGIPSAYTSFNAATASLEYHQTSDAIPDFLVNGNTKAVFNTGFLGIGTSSPTTGFTALAIKKNINDFLGMYIDAGTTGEPFYGFALNGVAKSYLSYASANNALEYHQSTDVQPDFFINGNTKAVFNTGFVGIGTGSPTSGFTSFAIKKNINDFLGMYIDAGTTGEPFYGFALNGVAKSYLSYASASNSLEYHQSTDGTPDFFINGNTKAVFNTGFVGIGTSNPTSGFTSFAIKKNINDFLGMYIDAGATGKPFYGYALNGIASAYTAFNAATASLEYHQTSDAIPDFLVNGNTKAVFNTGFVGIGTSNPTTGFTALAIKKNVNDFLGMYIDAGATGTPFYGYSLNGTAVAYTTYSGVNNRFEYHHSTDATPDFAVSNTQAIFPIQSFLGVGTSTPTNGSTGFTLKSTTSGFFGSYIDAGTGGKPFYGYAINGSPVAWTEFNGSNSNWELNYNGARIQVSAAGNVGMGTSPNASFKLDVGGNLRCVALTETSDVRFKTNIEPLESSLEKVEQLQGVSWNWKPDDSHGSSFSGEKQIGFVAQEVEKIIPEVVSTDTDGFKSINYSKLTALLAESIKTQQKQIEKQKDENDTLKKQLSELLNRIQKLEKK